MEMLPKKLLSYFSRVDSSKRLWISNNQGPWQESAIVLLISNMWIYLTLSTQEWNISIPICTLPKTLARDPIRIKSDLIYPKELYPSTKVWISDLNNSRLSLVSSEIAFSSWLKTIAFSRNPRHFEWSSSNREGKYVSSWSSCSFEPVWNEVMNSQVRLHI
jgi:hypothetical protein